VGYTAPSARFTDIENHWGKEAIDYVVGRGLLSCFLETTFAPDVAMTRGMLVTALGRLAGVDTKTYTKNSFTDVKADSAYRPYIEWAYSKGIIQGIGGNQFAPDWVIHREEIAVIFANYAKATGYILPITREATTYADTSSIGNGYKEAVKAMQQAGIMMGGSGNKFNPKGNATRAEVSAMLHRYIKLTINPATAQGWALNDDGQYMYYKDSKTLTGTQSINGVKYFFNTGGTLKTGWAKDGANWRYFTGNKAAVGWLDIRGKQYYFTKDGLMVSDKWLEIGGKWYYFNANGSLAKNTKIDGCEVDENGVRTTK
jgi:glucan-binding YG repeat protein